jgi:LETM1 and EF-hand domain-containing protein 1, mitochondrial
MLSPNLLANLISPLFLARTHPPSAFSSRSLYQLQRNRQTLSTHVQALAILIPRNRQYSTETSTSSGSGNSFPPPGFNAEQAKKPLPQDAPRKGSDPSSTTTNEKSKSESPAFTAKDNEKGILTEHGSAEAAVAEEAKRISLEKKEVKKKMTIMQKIKHEAQHYWDGTKLLATEIRISMKLAIKMAAGYELSRRENRQVSSKQIYAWTVATFSSHYTNTQLSSL